MHFYWQQLLSISNYGASATAAARGVQQPLSRILPSAPPLMLMLPLSQLADVAEGLAELRLCPEDAAVADLLEQIWQAVITSSSSSSSSALQGEEWQEAAAAAAHVPVAELNASAQQQRDNRHRQQQQSRSGFGNSKPNKQQPKQQQQQQQRRQQQSELDPVLLDNFDAASGGLWRAGVAGDWTFGQLAAAAAAFTPTSSSSSSGVLAAAGNRQTAAVEPAASWEAAAAAVSDFMTPWYAASQVMLPHAEPQAVVRMLIAVATVTSAQSCPFGPGTLPDRLLQQQGVVFQRAGQQISDLAGAAAADTLQSVPSTQPRQHQQQKTPNAAAGNDPRTASQQAKQQQQQQRCLLLPPLPPASWIAAAVQRLTVTRSAYSEVALLGAFEALAALLENHPDRQQLLMQPQQQQQQQQQWWWRQKELELSPAQLKAAAAPQWPGAQPADALLYSAAAAGSDDEYDSSDDEEDSAAVDEDADADSSSSSSVSAAEARRWSASWLHPAAAVDSSSGSGSSSSSMGCVSVLGQLAVLVKLLGNELGEMLPPDSMVEAAAAIAR
jgi:mannitol/fructose-specific phosphotransferase system IIA component (Ntr-type)